MHREQQHVLLHARAEKGRPQEGSRTEIKGTAPLARNPVFDFLFAIGSGQGFDVEDRQLDILLGDDPLHRLLIRNDKCGPEHFVTADDRGQGSTERVSIEDTPERVRAGNAIERVARCELFQEPNALLGKRERGDVALQGARDSMVLRPEARPSAETLLEKGPLSWSQPRDLFLQAFGFGDFH